jgi:hypothetical protein
MKRTEITSRIGDLQVEWATDHPKLSVRQFLITEKKFTHRQYRYIISKAPKATWDVVYTQVTNDRSFEKIKSHVQEAVRILGLSGTVAELVFKKAYKKLSAAGSELTSSELRSLMVTIERGQKAYISAMGPETYKAATPFAQIERKIASQKPQTQVQPAEERIELNYEETLDMIELRREFKRREEAILEKAKSRIYSGDTSKIADEVGYTCANQPNHL